MEGRSQDVQRAENINKHIKILCLLASFSHMNPVLNLIMKIFLIPEVNAYQTHARLKSQRHYLA